MKRPGLRRTAAALGAAGALLVLGACGSSSSSTATSPSASQPTSPVASTPSSVPSDTASSSGSSSAKVVITIKDYAYYGPGSVEPGATVTVDNEDPVAHTVTADDSSGGFDVKVNAKSSATFTAPDKPGDYAYHCIYHSNMHGMLKVS